ncbi:MAG: OmpH family outer membrane protein [Desulfomonilia bacterium]
MKHYALIFTAFILLISTGTVGAQDIKIVYIDSQRILYESLAGKDAYDKLSALKDQKETEIQKMQEKIKAMGDDIAMKSPTMNAAAKDELEMQYEQELKNYNRLVKDAQDELKRMEISLLKPWSKDLDDIIKEYGLKNSIDLILDKRNPAIIYASDRIDITDPIMEIFNTHYQEKGAKKE